MTGQRVAIVHEWLVTYAGSERVLREILALFPDADLFAVVDFLSDEDRARLFGKQARTTFIQRMPRAQTKYRAYLPLMPLAIEQLDLSEYDLVISSSHAVAKGVLTGPNQTHVCYCHTPIRYAWDLQHQYLRKANLDRGLKSAAARAMLHYIRLWDSQSARGVDRFIANSAYIAGRIRRVYRRDALVVHPPVDVDSFPLRTAKEDFYLTASRMVPYKRIDLIVEAFTAMPDRQLVVIGDGPEMSRVKAMAGPNVTLLGYQPDDVLTDHLQRARAFVFAAEEDFGILPVEAQACGTPVIAFGKGGALECVVGVAESGRGSPTGIFFYEQTSGAVQEAVRHFENHDAEFSAERCASHARRFAPDRFHKAFMEAVFDSASTEIAA